MIRVASLEPDGLLARARWLATNEPLKDQAALLLNRGKNQPEVVANGPPHSGPLFGPDHGRPRHERLAAQFFTAFEEALMYDFDWSAGLARSD